jgi:hypothetical protein
MLKKLALTVVLCLGVLTVSAQVTPPPAEDLNSSFKPLLWRSIGPFRGGRAVAATGVVGDRGRVNEIRTSWQPGAPDAHRRASACHGREARARRPLDPVNATVRPAHRSLLP